MKKIIYSICLLAMSGTLYADTLEIRNNHQEAYRGPVSLPAKELTGFFTDGSNRLSVTDGVLSGFVDMKPGEALVLKSIDSFPSAKGSLKLEPSENGCTLFWNGKPVTEMDFNLAILPKEGDYPDVPTMDYNKGGAAKRLKGMPLKEHAVEQYTPAKLSWEKDGDWLKTVIPDPEHTATLRLKVLPEGFIEQELTIQRKRPGKGGNYAALITRLKAAEVEAPKMRWNGELVGGTKEPEFWARNYYFSGYLDWFSWQANGLNWAWINRMSPGGSARKNTKAGPLWTNHNNFYIWSRMVQKENDLYFLSEFASPNPSRGSGYSTLMHDLPHKVEARLAISTEPGKNWEDMQFRILSGYRMAETKNGKNVVELGVPYTEFGFAYSPYSTLLENLHFDRVPGLSRESWWPMSVDVWNQWKLFKPEMQRDLRIIRAMGSDWVRLHHIEYLGAMERDEAYEFLDWIMAECEALGLKVLVDTDGSLEWYETIATRYGKTVKRIEIENEVLISKYLLEKEEKWKDIYKTVKNADPDMELFLTGFGNPGMFYRLQDQGVPFDRIGIHRYIFEVGPAEVIDSTMTGIGGVATDFQKPVSYTECNWKGLTRWTPERRAERAGKIYQSILKPRAVSTMYIFHFHETLCVNPMRSRHGIRHYEPIHYDRSPKPEARHLLDAMREYGRKDHPIHQLQISVPEIISKGGIDQATATISNRSDKELMLDLSIENFEGALAQVSPAKIALKPGESKEVMLVLKLPKDAPSGTRHVFLSATAGDFRSIGWGVYRRQGNPEFSKGYALEDKAVYENGPEILEKFDWSKPISICFVDKNPKEKTGDVAALEGAYTLFNTLQQATGRTFYLCQLEDMTEERLKSDNVILVGLLKELPAINGLVTKIPKGKGYIQLLENHGNDWLVLSGDDFQSLFAAAGEVLTRYWKGSPWSAMTKAGSEKGAGYGFLKPRGPVDLP